MSQRDARPVVRTGTQALPTPATSRCACMSAGCDAGSTVADLGSWMTCAVGSTLVTVWGVAVVLPMT